jgi:hypothetical protein
MPQIVEAYVWQPYRPQEWLERAGDEVLARYGRADSGGEHEVVIFPEPRKLVPFLQLGFAVPLQGGEGRLGKLDATPTLDCLGGAEAKSLPVAVESVRRIWMVPASTREASAEIRIYQEDGQVPVVICSQLPDNDNTSVTNMDEYLPAEELEEGRPTHTTDVDAALPRARRRYWRILAGRDLWMGDEGGMS